MKKAGFAAAAVSITGCRGITDAVVRDNKRHKPNLVYIFADQLGYKHCGYSGNEKAHTPNIDRLASEGADFFNAVSTMPVCSAHRASLFTGKYPTTTGMVINELRMNPNHRCFGHILTDSGYETGYIGKWHLYANNDKYADRWGRLSKEARSKLEEWRRIYYAQTESVDANLERILKAIKKAGIEDDTIVVFSSDHGEMFGAQGRRAKNIFYEEAARVPFIIRWPAKIAAGIKSDVCLGTVDIMPTVVGLMNLEMPKEVEGIDLSGCATGEKGDAPEFAFLQNTGACAIFEDGHEWRALRDKLFTYAKYRIDGFELLFDNKNDPYQMNNLSKNPEFKDNIEKYRKMLAEKMSELNDNFEKCTWYRDNFTDGNRIILHGAKG